MEKCGSCSSEIAENSRFCSVCGAHQGSEALITRTVSSGAQSTPKSPSPKPSGGSSSPRPSSSGVASVTQIRFAPGTLLAGRYRIVSLLGKGGMGEVYRADDLTLEQPVALKFLPESIGGNASALARFRNEVRIARQVSHPNVCRVYDVGEIDGQVFLSMEYVDGEDLASLLRRIGRLPADKALEISRKLCAGLAAAHERGVLHRDLKPSNIMLDGRGNVLLTDFGLAGLADQIEGAEVRNGTPAYMAPEQLSGQEVSIRSDIYSLGLVLYEIFTGQRPFEASTLAELVRLRSEATPVSLTSLVRDLDPAVERAILRCLDPDPARRPPSALAVAAALPGGDPLAAALAAGETPSPQMVAAAGEGAGLTPRVAIALLLVAVSALAIPYWIRNQRSVLNQIQQPFSPEVLTQKARDVIQNLGYSLPTGDDAYGFDWDDDFLKYAQSHDKLFAQRPVPLLFWYRSSPYTLSSSEFHDDLLTPGVVSFGDPPSVYSGMIRLRLDAQGRLEYFEAIPPQVQEPDKSASAVDWRPLFAASGLDLAQLRGAEPQWNWLAASDTRAAWIGNWPGTARPLRVEAASLRGKPVAFSLIGPWTKPGRMPPLESSGNENIASGILIGIAVVVMLGVTLLARRNQRRKNLGDAEGATRLGVWIGFVLVALWICRTHWTLSIDTFGIFLIEVATAIFYAFVVRTMYLALEPVRPPPLAANHHFLDGAAKTPRARSCGGARHSDRDCRADQHPGDCQPVGPVDRGGGRRSLYRIDGCAARAPGHAGTCFRVGSTWHSRCIAPLFPVVFAAHSVPEPMGGRGRSGRDFFDAIGSPEHSSPVFRGHQSYRRQFDGADDPALRAAFALGFDLRWKPDGRPAAHRALLRMVRARHGVRAAPGGRAGRVGLLHVHGGTPAVESRLAGCVSRRVSPRWPRVREFPGDSRRESGLAGAKRSLPPQPGLR